MTDSCPYILPAISFRRRGFEIPGFVKKYSNFEPKKQGVLTTKGALGRKNAIF